MTEQDQHRLVYDCIQRVAEEMNLELVELKIGVHKKDVFLQVLADKPEGKIGIAEVTKLNRSIVEAIDKEGFFSEDGYSLEVSSPGLDRPLSTSKDFLRNLNAEVRLWLKEKIAGKVEHVGIIKGVQDGKLVLFTVKEKEEIIVPIDQIIKCLLEI